MNHECIREYRSKKIDGCLGYSFHKCYGNNPMILEVGFRDKDGTECYFDNWVEIEVNFCPFCGRKSLEIQLSNETE